MQAVPNRVMQLDRYNLSRTVCIKSLLNVSIQVDDIEMKLDQLLELYMEDRKRFLALPFFADHSPSERPSYPPPPSMPNPSAVLKPKPILVDKQSSEPSSPITKNFKEPPTVSVTKKPMHRGFSDLGNRIKKKVTLRYPY